MDNQEINVMPIDELIVKVKEICLNNDVEHLKLIGSFATETATARGSIDFAVYGCKNFVMQSMMHASQQERQGVLE